MIAFAGIASILIALAAAAWIVVVSAKQRSVGSKAALRVPVGVFFAASVASFALLELGILVHDFSIAYVANNTATTTPLIFLFAAGWAALEGSIVLWGLTLAFFTWLVWRQMGEADPLAAVALGVMGAVSIFWFGLMATAGNPFAICVEVTNGFCSDTSWWPLADAVPPAEGLGPNPLLQNHILMAVHPPMLYLGYVGLTVPFAFAIAALIRGDVGRTWLDRTHRWSLVGWVFLTFGIILGGWWSYEVLGWGGYWAWDPVENAAILPWFTATAFIHSAVVQRKRGMLQAWNFMLVIATFALTILGTFLTRSGVITSVHAFTQSSVGPALLVFLAIIVFGSLGLFVWRSKEIAQAPRLDSLASREGFILANSLLLTVFTLAVLIGTIYPVLYEAFTGAEVSVGESFYDQAAVPISLLLLLALGAGAVAPWRVASKEVMWRRLRWAMATGLLAGAFTVLMGVTSISVVIAISLAMFVVAAIVLRYATVVGARPEGFRAMAKVVRNDPGYWGGQVAHIGVALMAIALATTNGLAVREEVSIPRGETAVVDAYCVEYVDTFSYSEPNRDVTIVQVRLLDDTCSNGIAVLEPRLNTYVGTNQPIATPDVWTGLIDDVYVRIAGGTAGEVLLHVYVYPFQWMLWAGGIVVVLGGFIAMFRKPDRRRRTSDQETTPMEASGV